MKKKMLWFLIGILSLLTFAACTAGGGHPAADTVESYLRALAEKDEATLVSLTCQDYEANALLEYDAFGMVETRLEGLECLTDKVEDGAAQVSCQGQIIATYGAENQSFELSGRFYRVIDQDGAWLVCGSQ